MVVCLEHGVELEEFCSSCGELLFDDKRHRKSSSVLLQNFCDKWLISCRNCNHSLLDEVLEKIQETVYGYQACLGKKQDGEPGDIWEIKGYANAEDDMPAMVRKVKLPIGQLRRAYPELFQAQKVTKCPRCGKELEIQKSDTNLDRNGLRVWVDCKDNICEFSKILELSIDDIIGIRKI